MLATFGKDRSDVQVFNRDNEWVCARCTLLGGDDWVNPDPVDLLNHLDEHTMAGDVVPSYCFTTLEDTNE